MPAFRQWKNLNYKPPGSTLLLTRTNLENFVSRFLGDFHLLPILNFVCSQASPKTKPMFRFEQKFTVYVKLFVWFRLKIVE
jgi:hypothetical protein